MKNILLIGLLMLLSITTFIGCKKEIKGCKDVKATNYNFNATKDDGSCIYVPPQGPRNPSFETAITSSDWAVSGSVCWNCTYSRKTGTGILPSQGSYYMGSPGDGSTGTITYEMNQEAVSFSHSSKLIFDYSVLGSNIGSGGSGKVEILFTSNGTVTLWSKIFSASSTPTTQQLNETVVLPSLPDKGKLIFRVTSIGTGIQPNPFSRVFFDIDNIRVQ